MGRSSQILCLIVDGDPSASNPHYDCFPPSLRHRYDHSGNLLDGETEPVAADIRKQADGPAMARLKIIAGMLGVGLDDLRRRELQRKQRRMAIVTASSLFAAAFTAVLALNAVSARNEAEQRRQQAENLLGFMVGDLRGSLATIGRLDLLEDVGQQAMNYFASVDVVSLTDDELLRQAQVLTQLGEIRIEQLQYQEAADAFMQAYERSAALYDSDPADGNRLFNRSQAEFWIGFVHWRSGSLNDARSWLQRYRNSALVLYSLDSTRSEWLREVAYGHHNLAVLDQEIGNLTEAEQGFLLETEILDGLLATEPSNSLLRSKADVLSYLGKTSLQLGNIDEAINYYKATVDIIRDIYAKDSGNFAWREDLAFATQLVAETTALTGDFPSALSYVDEANSIFDALIATDASNLNLLRGSTKPKITKGFIFAANGQWEQAEQMSLSAIEPLEGIVDKGNAGNNVRDHLASAYLLNAYINQNKGDTSSALSSLERAEEFLNSIASNNRLSEERTGMLASLLVMRGQLLSEQGDTDGASAAWQLSQDTLGNLSNTSGSPFVLDPWARTLFLTGRQDQAKEISYALKERNYEPLIPWFF